MTCIVKVGQGKRDACHQLRCHPAGVRSIVHTLEATMTEALDLDPCVPHTDTHNERKLSSAAAWLFHDGLATAARGFSNRKRRPCCRQLEAIEPRPPVW